MVFFLFLFLRPLYRSPTRYNIVNQCDGLKFDDQCDEQLFEGLPSTNLFDSAISIRVCRYILAKLLQVDVSLADL